MEIHPKPGESPIGHTNNDRPIWRFDQLTTMSQGIVVNRHCAELVRQGHPFRKRKELPLIGPYKPVTSMTYELALNLRASIGDLNRQISSLQARSQSARR